MDSNPQSSYKFDGISERLEPSIERDVGEDNNKKSNVSSPIAQFGERASEYLSDNEDRKDCLTDDDVSSGKSCEDDVCERKTENDELGSPEVNGNFLRVKPEVDFTWSQTNSISEHKESAETTQVEISKGQQHLSLSNNCDAVDSDSDQDTISNSGSDQAESENEQLVLSPSDTSQLSDSEDRVREESAQESSGQKESKPGCEMSLERKQQNFFSCSSHHMPVERKWGDIPTRMEKGCEENAFNYASVQVKTEKEDEDYLASRNASHHMDSDSDRTSDNTSPEMGMERDHMTNVKPADAYNPFTAVGSTNSKLFNYKATSSFSAENPVVGTSQHDYGLMPPRPASWEEMIQDMNKKLEYSQPGMYPGFPDYSGLKLPAGSITSDEILANAPPPTLKQPRSSTGGKLYFCPVCDRAFKTTSSLRNHIRTHTGEKPHVCSICQKAFSQSSNLITHMRIHTGDKPHQCAVCKKAFNTVSDLKHHMSIHTGIKPLECSVCQKGFNTNYKLKIHMRSHTGEKPHICSLCQTAFTRSYDLKIHIRTHTGQKDHHCTICHKAFSRRYELTSHMRTHTGEKPYRCKVCEKCFAESGSLANHMKIHTGEMPYMCGVCNKAFHHSSNLKRHMRSHIGEKPHLCTECDKAFNTTSDLKRHMETHTGDKNYECLVCFKAFRRSDHLKKHVKTHALETAAQACSPPAEETIPENLGVDVQAM